MGNASNFVAEVPRKLSFASGFQWLLVVGVLAAAGFPFGCGDAADGPAAPSDSQAERAKPKGSEPSRQSDADRADTRGTTKPEPAQPTIWEDRVRAIRFVCYHPSTGDPTRGVDATVQEVRKDLELARRAGFSGLVTYTARGVQGEPLVSAAESLGFEAIIIGVWDCKDAAELGAAKACAKSRIVLGYCVGNEGFEKRYNLQELSAVIDDLRKVTGKKVTTTEEIDDYYGEPKLFEISDWVFCNAHPFWHSRVEPEAAVEWTVDAYQDMKRRTDKLVLFKEVGLPTAGDAADRVSEATQDEYYRRLADTDVQFAYFEFCDLPWKRHHPVEPHWGIFRSDRGPKPLARRLLAQQRPKTTPAEARAATSDGSGKRPLLSTDGSFSVDQAYIPSGITGDIGDVRIALGEEGSTQFTYAPRGRGPHEWDYKYVDGQLSDDPARQAGVIWLSPANDFGATPECGYDLRGLKPKAVRWEARSVDGPVHVQFFVGGVTWKWVQEKGGGWTQQGVAHPGTIPYTQLGIRTLASEWQTFEAILPDAPYDFRRLVGGFGWTATWADNGMSPTAQPSREFKFEVRKIHYVSLRSTPKSDDSTFYVYRDADDTLNHFAPSGRMGDVGDVHISQVCREKPHSGKTCIRVVYDAEGKGTKPGEYPGWAGVYWQHPPNNWGKHAFWKGQGYDLSSYRRLLVWARADAPCRVQFLSGGINAPYGDSLKFPRKTVASVGRQWKQFTIDLQGTNVEHMIGGFGWTTNRNTNPRGAIFYLDDIRFVKE